MSARTTATGAETSYLFNPTLLDVTECAPEPGSDVVDQPPTCLDLSGHQQEVVDLPGVDPAFCRHARSTKLRGVGLALVAVAIELSTGDEGGRQALQIGVEGRDARVLGVLA